MTYCIHSGNILGWQGLVSVDGVTYNWMGGAPGPAPVNQVSLEYTSTKSIFTFDVDGKVTLTVTFLSPVYPDDMARQSQQFSYISTPAKSADGASHKVKVYMDVSGGTVSRSSRPIMCFYFANNKLRMGQRGYFSSCPVGYRHRWRYQLPQVLSPNPRRV